MSTQFSEVLAGRATPIRESFAKPLPSALSLPVEPSRSLEQAVPRVSRAAAPTAAMLLMTSVRMVELAPSYGVLIAGVRCAVERGGGGGAGCGQPATPALSTSEFGAAGGAGAAGSSRRNGRVSAPMTENRPWLLL